MQWYGSPQSRHLGDYEKSYFYDLSDEDDLTDFNIEQQASIIEDWSRIEPGVAGAAQ